MLKKDLIAKQKPVLDLYQALVELQKKLEQTGTHTHLEQMKFIDCEYKEDADPNAGGESKIDTEALEALRALFEKLVTPVLNYCKDVIVKREDILIGLETNPDIVKAKIPSLKSESEEMQKNLEEMRSEQEKNITNVVSYFQKALESSNTTLEVPAELTGEAEIERLKGLLQEKEAQLGEANKIAHDVQSEARKRNALQDELNKYKHHVTEMKQKIKVGGSSLRCDVWFVLSLQHLEEELENEKKQSSEVKSKSLNIDHKLRALKTRLQESDNKVKDMELKYKEAETKIR